ncbi:MAG: hypothetical protein ABII88_04845 [Candidatus Omnitrophota bacterium]
MKQDYLDYQLQKEREFEDICKRCGNCCGGKDDPCIHLVPQAEGIFICDIYSSRRGTQKTRSGKEFKCVFIREILHNNWNGSWNCAYKRKTEN